MADLLLPPHLRQARASFRYVDSTGSSRGLFTGALRTAARGGDRLGASIEFTPHGGKSTTGRSERAVMRSFLASLRGRQNRVYLFDRSYRRRGSMPTSELLTNNTFASGTTGWSSGSDWTIATSDRVLRLQRAVISVAQSALVVSNSVSTVAYAPYALRYMIQQGRGSMTSGHYPNYAGTAALASPTTTLGLTTGSLIRPETSLSPAIAINDASGMTAGDYFSIPYISLARCALVDNAPNSGIRSDEIDHAAWTKSNSSATANQHTSFDGTVTAEKWTEDNTNSYHSIVPATQLTRASAAEDWVSFGVFARSVGTRNVLLLIGSDASNYSTCIFDLGTSTAGTPTNTGTNTNARAFIVALGGGLYACYLVARLAASTTVYREYAIASGTSTTYLGDGASALVATRFGAARSSVPVRLGSATTTAGDDDGTAQTGSALYTKGWPASTDELLLADDQFEVITSRGSELKILTAPVNSDAAELAYMQFVPPLLGTPADNAPIIVHQPMGRFGYVGESPGWDNDPGFWSSASCEFEEACSAP